MPRPRNPRNAPKAKPRTKRKLTDDGKSKESLKGRKVGLPTPAKAGKVTTIRKTRKNVSGPKSDPRKNVKRSPNVKKRK